MVKLELRQDTLIDKIELRNGQIISIGDIDELIHKNVLYRNNDGKMYETEYGDEFSFLHITKDKWIHSFKAGVTGFGLQYTNLQMGIFDELVGNLKCNTVAECQMQMEKVREYLIVQYGLLTSFQDSKISMIELNRTFEIDYPFEDYHRVLNLLLAIMPKMNVVSFFGKTDKEHTTNISTYSAWSKGKKKKITFYDKGNQVKVSVSGNLMRVELMIKTSKNIKSAFGTDVFMELTQEKIDEYFEEQIQKLIVSPIEKWKANRNKFVLKLMKEEYEKEINNSWQVNVLRKLMNKEIEDNGKPCILGIEELCDLVDRYKGFNRKSRIKANFRIQSGKYERVFCNGDDVKLQEIIDKLLAKECDTVDLYVKDSVA